jgi:hypothetical protein
MSARLREGAQQRRLILDGMEPGHMDDVAPREIESQPSTEGLPIQCARIAFEVDAIGKNFDPFSGEAVTAAQSARAESANGVDGAGKRIEDRAIDGAAPRRDAVGEVSAMFREDQARKHSRFAASQSRFACRTTSNGGATGGEAHQGNRRVKERPVLMCMDDFNATAFQEVGDARGRCPVESGPPIDTNDLNALAAQAFAERPHGVEAEDDGFDLVAKSANDLRNEDLGAGDLHHMNDEGDAQAVAGHSQPRA